MSDEIYFDAVIHTFRRIMGRSPLVLRNPFTGKVFWVEGMHNCDRAELARAHEAQNAADNAKRAANETRRLLDNQNKVKALIRMLTP